MPLAIGTGRFEPYAALTANEMTVSQKATNFAGTAATLTEIMVAAEVIVLEFFTSILRNAFWAAGGLGVDVLQREVRMKNFKAVAVLVLTALVAFPIGAHAASLSGTWSGSGYVIPKDGPRESVRCRVTFSQESSKLFAVKAVCASTSTKIIQTGEVLMVNPNRYVGDFYNAEYDIAGRVRISLSGSSQTVTFSSKNGHGSMTLRKR